MEYLVHNSYGSVEDFLDYISENPPSESWSIGHSASSRVRPEAWNGGDTYDQCVEKARYGWPEGVSLMESVEVGEAIGHKSKVQFFDNVRGFRPIVPAYLAGRPKDMLDIAIRSVEVPAVCIKMVASTGAWITAEEYKVRGAVMASLIDSLEESGVRVELHSVWETVASRSNGERTRCEVKVKSYDQPLDKDALAFVSIHPGWLRRLMFAWLESHGNLTHRLFVGSYGRPQEGLPDTDCFVVKSISKYGREKFTNFREGMEAVKEDYESWLVAQKNGL